MSENHKAEGDQGLEMFPSLEQPAPIQTLQPSTNQPTLTRRGRARSTTIVGAVNPLECPVSVEEQHLAALAQAINRVNRRRASASTLVTGEAVVDAAVTTTVTSVADSTPTKSSIGSAASTSSHQESSAETEVSHTTSNLTSPTHLPSLAATTIRQRAHNQEPSDNQDFLATTDHIECRPSPRPASTPVFEAQIHRAERATPSPEILARLQDCYHSTMQSYPNYLDSPQTGPSPNPRQAPPSPSQGIHQNGMNGGMGLAGGMVGFPTPAGHQSDLNYIMQMVEELAGQLAHNQGLTAGIVDKMGKVRAKAKNMDLSNDELITIAASELNETSENLEKENSELRQALEKTIHDKKENWKLAIHGANILADVLDKMHKFKASNEADTLAWHRNYRKQLADEREENLNLRNQINDMKAAACRANEHLRGLRRYLTDHDELNELRIRNIQLRQERRLWKRMALPLIPQDDSEWSDDDDIIDPEEKKRLAAEKADKDCKDQEGDEGGDAHGPSA